MTSDWELLEPLRHPRPELSTFDADQIIERADRDRRKGRAATSAVVLTTIAVAAIAASLANSARRPDTRPAQTAAVGGLVVRDCATLPQVDPMQAGPGPSLADSLLLRAKDFSEPWVTTPVHAVGPAPSRPATRNASADLVTSEERPAWFVSQRVTEADSRTRAEAQFVAVGRRLLCREAGGTSPSGGVTPPSSALVVSDTVRSGARILVTRRTEHGDFDDGPWQSWGALVVSGSRISEVDLRSSTQLSPTSRSVEPGWVSRLAELVADRLQGRETGRLPALRTTGAPSPGSSPGIDGSPRLEVSGALVLTGGPVAAHRVPASGTVIFLRQSDGARVSVATVGGRFETRLPAGRYTVGGRSPQFNEGRTDCRAPGTVVVTAHTAPVEVVCPMK